jgi:protein involved in polysaccharide export with SLBB domain
MKSILALVAFSMLYLGCYAENEKEATLTIFIFGEVNSPEVYPNRKQNKFRLPAGSTLIDALTVAKGTNKFSKKENIWIIRGEQTKVYNLDEIALGNLAPPVLRNFAVIYVPTRPFD